MKNKAKSKGAEKKAKKKNSPAIILLRLTAVFFAVFALVRFFVQQPVLNQCNQKIDEYSKQIEAEKESIEHYKNMKELYQTDEYKMIIAKERLGLVEENEKVYVDANGK